MSTQYRYNWPRYFIFAPIPRRSSRSLGWLRRSGYERQWPYLGHEIRPSYNATKVGFGVEILSFGCTPNRIRKSRVSSVTRHTRAWRGAAAERCWPTVLVGLLTDACKGYRWGPRALHAPCARTPRTVLLRRPARVPPAPARASPMGAFSFPLMLSKVSHQLNASLLSAEYLNYA